ncbi:MAG TPA: carboxypeptidase-like regulatory domain-containing protein, partial [Bacteroidales bacterium]|nr:carboxypeptidase-like regulatory domain-containing protein [Bacteroidales bacterium]
MMQIKTNKLFLTLFLVFFCLLILARNSYSSILTGHVVDADTNEPLIGVNVIIKGTFKGVVTDSEGYFHLETDSDSATIILSYIG